MPETDQGNSGKENKEQVGQPISME